MSAIQSVEIGDATVVHFTERKILDALRIQQIGIELGALVNDDGRRTIVLNFSTVDYMSSAMLGTLITFNKRVAAHAGRLALCGLRPEIFEVFKVQQLHRIFRVYHDEESALDALDGGSSISSGISQGITSGPQRRRYAIQCPADRCTGVEEVKDTAFKGDAQATCPACGSTFTLHATMSDQGAVTAWLKELVMPTWDGESVRLLPQQQGVKDSARRPATLALHGRLDVFASEALAKAWRSLPQPRRVLVDLTKASDISPAGVEAVLKLCADGEDGGQGVLLVTVEQQRLWPLLQANPAVHTDDAQAIAALPRVAAEHAMTVVVREITSGVASTAVEHSAATGKSKTKKTANKKKTAKKAPGKVTTKKARKRPAKKSGGSTKRSKRP